MNVPQREDAVARARSRRAGRKRERRLLLAALAALAVLVLVNAGPIERWLPKQWFREVSPVTGLHPVVAMNMDRLIADSAKIGIGIRITDGFRSVEEQDALYRQGRTADGPIVTQVKGGQSYHNYGLAIDFALELPDGQVIWDLDYDGNGNGTSDWMEVVEIAKKLGFSWGGDWEGFPDYPHLQMDFGYTIGELQRGWRPPEQLPEE
ncbi:M15 family metallopeptidase [Paenibacillaceae bacterium WGS1546]|uniref:M15 family metallopeptidase n=1 Tax=Cohnella sp. WGS1546 TaxID=3366810 RepID=UPI00372D632B